ncbi:MAG: helix-turn-helix domain-containing protein [Desulfobulbus sp.]
MSGHTNNYQTIEFNGAPAFVFVPVKDFRRIQPLLANGAAPGGIPHAVIKANLVGGRRLIRAWRKHLGQTQEEVAAKAGISQPALAKIERPGARPRRATLKKIAEAMGLTVEQIEE